MAVEIQVLSGSQQGRCLRVSGDRILVGDVAIADVRFDPARDAGVQGKNAVITLDDEEGWRISNVGAGVWLVNQTAVGSSQTHRLRSEDLVRVSEAGPDFCFRIVALPHGEAIPATAASASGEEPPVSTRQEIAVPPTRVAPGDERQSGTGLCPAIHSPVQSALDRGTTPADHEGTAPDDARREEEDIAAALIPGPFPASEKGAEEHTMAVMGESARDEPGGLEQLAQTPREPRKRIREASLVVRLIGLMISGLLGLACAYGIAYWVGGEKNDVLHVFHKEISLPLAPLPSGRLRPAGEGENLPSPPAPLPTMLRTVPGEGRDLPLR